jgi:UDP-glucose 4-epimerase
LIVTGVTGYVWFHIRKALRNAGYTPITMDNLSSGCSEAVKFGPVEVVDMLERTKLDQVFELYQPHAVMQSCT